MKIRVDIKEASMKTFPLPVTLVTSIDNNGNPNIITITYITGVNEEPPMIAIAIRPEKYSNKLIKESKEFVINVPTKELLPKVDFCGSYSGRDINKFDITGLTQERATKLKTPLIKECPINIECELSKVIVLPSHDLFVGRAMAVHIKRELLNKKSPDFSKLDFLLTTFLDYRVIGGKVGTAFEFGRKLV